RIFGLEPGRYYLSATYRSGMFEYSLDRSASQQPDEDYVPTYYPGTTDSSTAATVDLAAGAQVRGVGPSSLCDPLPSLLRASSGRSRDWPASRLRSRYRKFT